MKDKTYFLHSSRSPLPPFFFYRVLHFYSLGEIAEWTLPVGMMEVNISGCTGLIGKAEVTEVP